MLYCSDTVQSVYHVYVSLPLSFCITLAIWAVVATFAFISYTCMHISNANIIVISAMSFRVRIIPEITTWNCVE